MKTKNATIVFVDNQVEEISKTLIFLKKSFKNLVVLNSEKLLFEFLKENTADVIILNLDLVPNDGISIMKEIRSEQNESAPFIIIYSDKQDDFLQELAYNSGVDSFIDFHRDGPVFYLFLKNILRRRLIVNTFNKREIIIDKEKYLIFHNGLPVQLPKKEFRLFELLYNNSDKYFSKPEIATLIWEDESISKKRIIDVHIYNIRQFFGKHIIRTKKGNGYRFNQKPEKVS